MSRFQRSVGEPARHTGLPQTIIVLYDHRDDASMDGASQATYELRTGLGWVSFSEEKWQAHVLIHRMVWKICVHTRKW